MDKDVISQTLIKHSTITIIQKLYKLAFFLIVLQIVYSISDLIDWYLLLNNLSSIAKQSVHFIYRYEMRPVIAITSVSAGLMSSLLIYNAYGFMICALENKDSSLSNKGFKKLYNSLVITCFSYSISVLSIIYRIYITTYN